MKLVTEKIAELSDDRRCNSPVACIELPFENFDVGLGAGLLRANVAQFGGDLRIVRAQRLVPHQLDDSCAFAFKLGQPRPQSLQFGGTLRHGGFRPIQPRLKKRGQPSWLNEMAGHRPDHQIIQMLHRNAASRTRIRPALDPGGARIVAILTGFAGAGHHSRAAAILAATANRAAGKQIHVGLRRRLTHPRIAVGHLLANGVEGVFVDDRRHRNGHPFDFGPRLACTRVPAVEDHVSDIGGVGKDVVQRPDTEPFAPDAVAALVQVMGKAGDADRTIGRALQIGLEGVPDHVDRLGVMLQFLAVLTARLRHVVGAETDRRRLPVPKAVHRIGDHRPPHMLGVFRRMIFVEDR
nr:hypothetical protein [Sphingomonas sp. PP-CE-3A-406]